MINYILLQKESYSIQHKMRMGLIYLYQHYIQIKSRQKVDKAK